MLQALASAFLDLLYPPRCAACGEPAGHGPFCEICAEAVDEVGPCCPRCGAPGIATCCGPCHAAPPAFLSVAAGGLYGGPLADAVRALKYGGRPAVARPLGGWLAQRAALPRGAVLLAIPLARRRRLVRGYDQAALLAGHLARAGAGRLLRGALRRVRETPSQVGRSRVARARNVAGAFAASRAVRGLDVWLVDDVVTTGATADAAARALLEAGAHSVRVVALARAE